MDSTNFAAFMHLCQHFRPETRLERECTRMRGNFHERSCATAAQRTNSERLNAAEVVNAATVCWRHVV
eukprot:6190423-Pleurochrysis_carterae.AAC.3